MPDEGFGEDEVVLRVECFELAEIAERSPFVADSDFGGEFGGVEPLYRGESVVSAAHIKG